MWCTFSRPDRLPLPHPPGDHWDVPGFVPGIYLLYFCCEFLALFWPEQVRWSQIPAVDFCRGTKQEILPNCQCWLCQQQAWGSTKTRAKGGQEGVERLERLISHHLFILPLSKSNIHNKASTVAYHQRLKITVLWLLVGTSVHIGFGVFLFWGLIKPLLITLVLLQDNKMPRYTGLSVLSFYCFTVWAISSWSWRSF